MSKSCQNLNYPMGHQRGWAVFLFDPPSTWQCTLVLKMTVSSGSPSVVAIPFGSVLRCPLVLMGAKNTSQ